MERRDDSGGELGGLEARGASRSLYIVITNKGIIVHFKYLVTML